MVVANNYLTALNFNSEKPSNLMFWPWELHWNEDCLYFVQIWYQQVLKFVHIWHVLNFSVKLDIRPCPYIPNCVYPSRVRHLMFYARWNQELKIFYPRQDICLYSGWRLYQESQPRISNISPGKGLDEYAVRVSWVVDGGFLRLAWSQASAGVYAWTRRQKGQGRDLLRCGT